MTTYGTRLEAAIAVQVKVELAGMPGGMGQKDLAEKVGIHPVTMSLYMSGKRAMPMSVFFAIAEVFGISPRELMERAEARISK